MHRRNFMFACAASALAASLPATPADASPRFYARARLVDPAGRPLRASALPANRNFIFHYPFAGTPCFLLNLGKPTKPSAQLKTANEQTYEWPGGVGAEHSIVAYSAICAHRLTYPTREISFISYRGEKSAGSRFAQVIHCCSEHSQYDPAEGAKVLAGPAPQPLAAILLEHDRKDDGLYAAGTLGGELFNEFFSKYEFRLALDHGGHAHTAVESRCTVSELTQYCRQQVKC
ncbi:MAG TPA: (2Fe-2S)-binding protein [Burkholderiales bacterium]|jgi:arsenite oxidase small subunit|nr:(2Fe-2S)-binding protein [Burkholderiales bacterium]